MSDSKPTILFVDDEHLICDIFTEYFDLEGYNTFKRNSGKEAIEFLLEEGDKVDIVVTDIKMNDGDGLWLIDQINQNKLNKKVFIMTAHLEFTLDELQSRGVLHVFHKPAKFNEVQEKIESFF
jgi:DNA-binding NtrC family response regulator